SGLDPGTREPTEKCWVSLYAFSSSVTYESGFHHQWGSSWAIFCGSKTHTGAVSSRTPRVPSTTSRLFEVETTAPGASRIAGMTREVDLPVRGPQMSRLRS